MNSTRPHSLTRKLAIFAAVLVSAFLAGWSSTGVWAGVALALALGAGTAVPVFTDTTGDCSLRAPRRLRRHR